MPNVKTIERSEKKRNCTKDGGKHSEWKEKGSWKAIRKLSKKWKIIEPGEKESYRHA